jgi:methionyl-tRNA formyltransferase
MTKISAKIVFFGNERLATGVTTDVLTLKALIREGYDVVAVVSHNESTNSRKQRTLEIAEVAKEHNIPLLLPAKPADIIDQLREFKADIGVLVAYGKIVPQSVIDVFPHGIINIHPSLLPTHRGPTPIESVILAGEPITGVSVMQLSAAMDAGPIFDQVTVKLDDNPIKQELVDELLAIGSDMIVKNLPAILDGSLAPREQDELSATYDLLITKEMGVLDYHKTAAQLDNEIRAYAGWPGSRTTIAGKEVIITQAHAVPVDGTPGEVQAEPHANAIMIYCKYGYLCVEKLTPAGKPEMTAQAFLNGYKI